MSSILQVMVAARQREWLRRRRNPEVVGSRFLLSMEVTSVMARLPRRGSVSLLSVWDHQDLRDLQAGLVCQVETEHQEHQDLLV